VTITLADADAGTEVGFAEARPFDFLDLDIWGVGFRWINTAAFRGGIE
jgi:hypothetical protein